MFCESYREPLIDALAAGEPLTDTLAKHVASCGACSVAFAKEQALFAEINHSLGVSANAPVPPLLVPRLQAQLAASPAKVSWRTPVLAFATLSLVAGAIAIAPIFHRRPTPGGGSRGKAPVVAAAVRPAGGHESIGSPIQTAPHAKRSPRLKRVVLSQARVRSDLRVLVSPGEQAGLEHYAIRLRARGLENSARAAAIESDPELNIRPLEIAAMDTRQLTIEPLETDE
jgi:hypothetical protein